ncbi:endonuclease domain-containing protein [Microbacterium xanthum]|uniref:endonuclease domain-containing protein n=1 Tax=Microbacterium xanthum TaxID=3079794 RepID=UPI002AD5AC82|nr:DUF559 domain-containing protein [Microbacterium sp. KSW-48]MDZ8171803.1 DUF559 domain-containing protein [Microbacterium sp. KSW-48]
MCGESAAVWTYAALRAAGCTRRAVESRRRDGELVLLRRGVYADRDTCDLRRAAALHGGAIACVTAARHAGLWTLAPPDEVHVWLRGHGHRRVHDACTCVEHWDDALDERSAFAAPSIPRLLRQILACRGVEEFFVALESALHLRLITRSGVAWLRAHANDTAREAIDFARGDAESGLESVLRWRLRGAGVRIRAQVSIVSVGRVDFLLGDRLIVEVDGVENHDGPTLRHKDLVRDANAAAWGYTTLRFDYALVVHDWPAVEAAILAHLDRGSHLRRRGGGSHRVHGSGDRR